MYLRSALVCALLAMIACASAQDVAKCKSDGASQAAKVAQEACTSVLAACKGGKKWPGFVSTKGFDKPCTTEAFTSCAGDTSTSMTKCTDAPMGGATVEGCAATDFKYLYQEEVNNRCSDFALKLYPSPRTSGTSAVTRPAAEVTPTTTDNTGGAAEETAGDGHDHDGVHDVQP